MRSWFALILILPVLASCSWFEKNANPPLEGERIDILPPQDQAVSDSPGAPALGPTQDVASWSAVNGNTAQTGVNVSLSPKFDERWSTSIGEAIEGRKQITARLIGADGKIFAMNNRGDITALNATDGKILWQVRSRQKTGTALAGGMTYDNGILFATNGFPEILALSAANGGKIWSADLDAPARTAPTAANGRVFVISRGSQSYAFDAASGKILWQHRGLQESAAILSGAAPATDNDVVMLPYPSGEVLALSTGNGSVLWGENLSATRMVNNLSTLRDLRAPPMLLNDTVIAANYASNIAAVERRSGERMWNHDFGAIQPMTVSGDTLFLISTNAQLVALNYKTGNIFWSRPLSSKEHEAGDVQEYWYGPLLLNNQIFVISSEGQGELRDAATGKVLQSFDDLDTPAENPIVMNGMIYWVTAAGKVVAYQ